MSETILITTKGQTQTVKPAGKAFTLEELQKLVDGDIEIRYWGDNQIAIFNEDGWNRRMHRNALASEKVGVELLGPVVIGPRSILK